ncbi:MAG: hypothetical protein JXA98_06500, partial [Methanosarcinaceae archaeon]|nr:hypothetical protein [Methanosarcinaceae archaeon]
MPDKTFETDISNVLYINLSSKTSKVVKRQELYERCIGGTGVATELMLEEFKEGTDALSPDAPIIMAIGPLSG